MRRRLALEFVLIAGAIHLVLIVVTIAVRESQLRHQFDDELLRRVERIAGAAAQDLVPPTAISGAIEGEVRSSEAMPLLAQARSLAGEVLDSTANLEGAVLPLPFQPDPASPRQGPYFTTVDGAELGRNGEQFRLVTVHEEGPPPYYLVAAASHRSVAASAAALRRLMFLLALPGAMLGAGVAAWLISGHVVRRIDDVARAVQRVNPSQAHPRVDLPAAGDEIGGMVVEMNSMLSRLENAFRAQERFIVDVTHELKTPVSVMLAEAQVLKNSKSASLERYQHFVGSVEEEMRRLGSLLESFLTLARSGHGPRYVSESLVEMSDIVLDAIQRCDSLARDRQVALKFLLPSEEEAGAEAADEIAAGIAVRGDQELLTTLVTNLVRNAVESSVPESTVEIGISLADSEVKVSVVYNSAAQDAGIGLRGRELAFNVAKGIAELHGGDIHTGQRGGREESSLRLPVVRAA